MALTRLRTTWANTPRKPSWCLGAMVFQTCVPITCLSVQGSAGGGWMSRKRPRRSYRLIQQRRIMVKVPHASGTKVSRKWYESIAHYRPPNGNNLSHLGATHHGKVAGGNVKCVKGVSTKDG
jgi:hypothetical protein